jgi:hypothetical protein
MGADIAQILEKSYDNELKHLMVAIPKAPFDLAT